MASLVSPSLIEDNRDILGTLSSVLDQMIDHGNLIAANQKAELNQLGNLCARMKGSPTLASHPGLSQLQERMSPATGPTSGPLDHDLNTYMAVPGIENNDANNSREVWTGPLAETSERVNDMSPSQLLDVVDMLNGENLLDWLDLPTGASEFGNDGQPPG